MAWTDARIAELTRLWTSGVSASGIAEALGEVSRSAVLGKLHRLKLLGSRKPAAAPRRFEGPIAAPGSTALARAAARPAATGRGAGPPAPPRSPWREAAFAPLPGATPRPWLSRAPGECAFPVGGEGKAVLSCCAPSRPWSAYCAHHHRIVFRPAPAAMDASDRRAA